MTDEAWRQSNFSKEEIRYGIDQYAQVCLGMSGDDFIEMVKRGESVSHLHHRARDVANLVALLDGETDANDER